MGDTGDELTDDERAAVLASLRYEIREHRRQRHQLVRKYGDAAVTDRVDTKIRLLVPAFIKLGGDPARIGGTS